MVSAAREQKEIEKERKDAIGKYFLDLSKLSFGGLALGNMMALFTQSEMEKTSWLFGIGLLATFLFAITGNEILKHKAKKA